MEAAKVHSNPLAQELRSTSKTLSLFLSSRVSNAKLSLALDKRPE